MQRETLSHPSISAKLPTSKSDTGKWHQQDKQRNSSAEPGPGRRIVREEEKENCHFKPLCLGMVCQQQLITKILVIHRCPFFLNTRQLFKWQENMANISPPQPSRSTGWLATDNLLRRKHALSPKFPWFFPHDFLMAMQRKMTNFWQSGALTSLSFSQKKKRPSKWIIHYWISDDKWNCSKGCGHIIFPVFPLTSALSSPTKREKH